MATAVSEQPLGFPLLHGGEEDTGAVLVNGPIPSLSQQQAQGFTQLL